jgi:hypothetical protein
MASDGEILAFCHIIKAAGTTFSDMLRKKFGVAHLNVEPGSGNEIYNLKKMRRDFRYMPWIKSIAGHGLRPHEDYGEFSERIKWITWLRNPESRLISGYQHGVEKGGVNFSFEEWLRQPNHKNRQVYFLSGSEDDLEGAKQVIQSKNIFVGLVEHFDLGIALLNHTYSNKYLNLGYQKRSNIATTGNVAAEIYKNYEKYKEQIHENVYLDKQLYDRVYKSRYLPSVKDFNIAGVLDNTASKIRNQETSIRGSIKMKSNIVFRHALYKPILSKL